MNPLYLIDSLILTLSLGLYVLFHQPATIVPILLALLTYRFLRSRALWQKGFSLASSLALVIGWWSDRYSLAMLAATLTGVTGLSLVLSHLLKNGRAPQTVWGKVRRGLASLALLGLVVGHLFLTYNVINPDFMTRQAPLLFSEKTPPKEANLQRTEELSEGRINYYNLTYPSHLLNNTMDIYTTPQAKGTLVYIHGGGYAAGDKWNREDYLFRYVKDGYNVVNVNYQLSPAARYPDGLTQVDQALADVVAQATTYGIDPDSIILSGDSAGGQLAGQLALVLTNKDYAKAIDFTPKSQVIPKAYIGVSAWSDIQLGMRMGEPVLDWFIAPVPRSYFQVLDVEQAAIAEEASIVKHVDAHFPASFISDGNTGSFTTANLALVDRLKALGVTVESQFYDKKDIELHHIFELDIKNPYAQEVYAKHLTFLEKILAD
ncbi:alpha/beta hydrolase [Streptococcus ovuberis]|uniref:Alpha/beta hydrolase n=1 Tax=Streptococcus ovuberis TaxID=1936207 RepID=A0A7X6MXU6_9STRE|nr:alpha/beta hydrolase [Streptococcus ovuberis]NKZ19724.1 alpha/beta hydrolase [Streptococcus ovuberis]